MLFALLDHFWQSTLFAALAGLLTLALRKNHARVRHSIWLAASCKFLVPLSLLVTVGSHIEWRTAPVNYTVSEVMIDVSQPFTKPAFASPVFTAQPVANPIPAILLGIWLVGVVGISGSWCIRWRRIYATVRAGSPPNLQLPIKAIYSPTLIEPGVFGIFRPILLLPEGIAHRLTPAQLKAVIAHELCHVRHRDNLTATIQMFIETIFWFHPLIWWIGKQMIAEREQACDEEVLRCGSEPHVYAEGILKVCKLYVESPLICMSGVTGSDLKKRIKVILASQIAGDLSFTRKAGLAIVGIGALVLPILIGTIRIPTIHAQSSPAFPSPIAPVSSPQISQMVRGAAQTTATPPPPTTVPLEFDAASIKPVRESSGEGGRGGPPSGHLRFEPGRVVSAGGGVTARRIVLEAYRLTDYQLSGGPAWVNSDRFELEGKTATPAEEGQMRLMLQTLLAQRFTLSLRREAKEMPVYVLTVAKNGPRLHGLKDGETLPTGRLSRDQVIQLWGRRAADAQRLWEVVGDMGQFVNSISHIGSSDGLGLPAIDRPVLDKTGIRGVYWFHLGWDSDADLIPAIQDELGLKFESQTAPVDTLIIDHIEKPSEN